VQKELALSEISKAGEKCVRLFETILGLTPDFSRTTSEKNGV